MRVLYVGQHYDYGDPSRGFSFEYYNFYQSLCAMGLDVDAFDYPTLVEQLGRAEANRSLEKIVRRDKPDVLFAVVRGNQVDRRVIRRISQDTDTVTINWFCDDHWEFDTLSRQWTPCFNHVVTTSQTALAKYRAHGLTNVIKSQWGANDHLYRPSDEEPRYDVTFVGQPYGIREEAIEALRQAGVSVRTFGSGWPSGKISQEEMIRVFGQSRINLNFSDASRSTWTVSEAIATSHAVTAMRNKPGLWRVWSAAQRIAQWDRARAERHAEPPPRQIKGRVFEVPACGGFLLTQPAEDMNAYLSPGSECATFETIDELVDVTRYYLAHESERAAIASAGCRRTLAEHRWSDRLTQVFREAGVLLTEATRADQKSDPIKIVLRGPA